MRISVLLILAIFVFQTFDIPPSRNMPNPKTCCGRAVCMCKHEKGAFCPFRHGLPEDLNENEIQKANLQHKSCHLHKAAEAVKTQKIKDSFPITGFAFTKAPCASDAPKTVLPEYSKDFLFPTSSGHFVLAKQGSVPFSSFNALPLLREQGIERPPRIF